MLSRHPTVYYKSRSNSSSNSSRVYASCSTLRRLLIGPASGFAQLRPVRVNSSESASTMLWRFTRRAHCLDEPWKRIDRGTHHVEAPEHFS